MRKVITQISKSLEKFWSIYRIKIIKTDLSLCQSVEPGFEFWWQQSDIRVRQNSNLHCFQSGLRYLFFSVQRIILLFYSNCSGFWPIHLCLQKSPALLQVHFTIAGYRPSGTRYLEPAEGCQLTLAAFLSSVTVTQ